MAQAYYRLPSSGLKLIIQRGRPGWQPTEDVQRKGRPSNVALAEQWLDDLARAYRYSPTYVVAGKYTLMRYLQFLADRGAHVSEVGKREFLEYVKDLRSDPKIQALATLRRHLNILVSFYRELGEDEMSGVEEFAWARLASIRRKQRTDFENGHPSAERRALTEEEAHHLLEGIHDLRDKALLALLWATGIRNGEAIALRAPDIFFDDRGAVIKLHPHAKRDPTKKDLMVAFTTPEVAEILRAYLRRARLDPTDTLFPSHSKKPLTRTDLNRRVTLWASRTGTNGNGGPKLTAHAFATRSRRCYESEDAPIGASRDSGAIQDP